MALSSARSSSCCCLISASFSARRMRLCLAIATFFSANIFCRSSSLCLASSTSSSKRSFISRASSCLRRSSSSFLALSADTCSSRVRSISLRRLCSLSLSLASLCSLCLTRASSLLCQRASSSRCFCFCTTRSSSALSRECMHSCRSVTPSCSRNASHDSRNCRSSMSLANSLFSCSRRRTSSRARLLSRSLRISGVSSSAWSSRVYSSLSALSIAASWARRLLRWSSRSRLMVLTFVATLFLSMRWAVLCSQVA
mmetsp:Transcript_34482/g.88311  ORF Transcript_34482/g.88311 Transcript_34482/m.88311 type:complete len:255 (-) Transcript_34482:164-928(-)